MATSQGPDGAGARGRGGGGEAGVGRHQPQGGEQEHQLGQLSL